MKIIEQNPFRILGVYSNSKPAEIVSNCDDMEAYLSIGQNIQFDLDFNNLLPEVIRTDQTVTTAKSQINLPKDKLKYALFWFFRDSSSSHAMNYLKNGEFDNIYDVLDIEDSFSSMVNKAVTGILQDNDLGFAIANITEMIHDDDLRNNFVKAVCGETFSITEDELAHLYINALLEETPAQSLMELLQENGVSEDDDIYIKEKVVNEPLSKINAEISKAKSVSRDDAEANYRTGKTLIETTKADLAKVKNLLGTADMKYQMIADDLANTILQCGINYYNHSNEDEEEELDKALDIQKYALSIAAGKLTKDRCKKNVEILEKKKKQLPPSIVKEHDTAIKAKILELVTIKGSSIDNAITLMKECAPHIVAIKEHPELHEYYLNISTQVVNAALSSVIEEYNTTFERLKDNLENASQRGSAIKTINRMMEKAWKATLMMDKFDKEESFKNERYNGNRKSLYESVEASGAFELSYSLSFSGYASTHKSIPRQISNDEFDLRTEEEVWCACRTLADFESYLNRYPNAKHKTEAKNRRDKLLKEKEEKERQARLEREEEDKIFKTCSTISDFKTYLQKYPNGHYKWKAEKSIDDIKKKRKNVGCIIAIIAFILAGGIIGASADDSGSGKGFFIGCGVAAAFLIFGWLKSL